MIRLENSFSPVLLLSNSTNLTAKEAVTVDTPIQFSKEIQTVYCLVGRFSLSNFNLLITEKFATRILLKNHELTRNRLPMHVENL